MLIAQIDDEDLFQWLLNAHAHAGDFLKALAEAGLRADMYNYPVLRPVLLEMKLKYPQYLNWPKDRDMGGVTKAL